MKIMIIQGIFLVGIFSLNMLCLMLPQWIFPKSQNRQLSYKSQRIMSFCDCVSGGVFLGVCFVGLLPMVRDVFRKAFDMMNVEITYPVSETVIILGFFLMLLMEQCIHQWQDNQKKSKLQTHEMLKNEMNINSGDTSTEESDTTEDEIDMQFKTEREALVIPSPTDSAVLQSTAIVNGTVKKPRRPMRKKNQGHGSHSHTLQVQGDHCHSHLEAFQASSGLRCGILMLVLSIHSIFEGMAVGLQTEISKLINLYIGVLIHECLVALAIGTSLAKTGMQTSTVVKLGLLFSVMIPVGMGLGLLLGQSTTAGGIMTSGVVQALAAGTFIYVIFLEILPGEINSHGDRFFKLCFLFLGFTLIAGVTAVTLER